MTNNKVNQANEQSAISMEDIRRLKQRLMEECKKDSFKHDAKVVGIGAGVGVGLGVLIGWLIS